MDKIVNKRAAQSLRKFAERDLQRNLSKSSAVNRFYAFGEWLRQHAPPVVCSQGAPGCPVGERDLLGEGLRLASDPHALTGAQRDAGQNLAKSTPKVTQEWSQCAPHDIQQRYSETTADL